MDTVLKCPWCGEQIQKTIVMFSRCPHCAGCVVKVRGNLRRDGVFVQGTDNWASKRNGYLGKETTNDQINGK